MISISPPALSASRSDYEASRSGMRAKPLTLPEATGGRAMAQAARWRVRKQSMEGQPRWLI